MASDPLDRWLQRSLRPRVVVVGNQKGGSGKSTVAMHLIVGLMKCGYAVGSLDLDGAQGTLSEFLTKRAQRAGKGDTFVTVPRHVRIGGQPGQVSPDLLSEDSGQVAEALLRMVDCDYIVIDTPGSDTGLSRLGHILADTLLTPLNDSFLDLHVLVRLDQSGRRVVGPSSYSLAVLERWGARLSRGGKPLDWIVLRNRVAYPRSRNQQHLQEVLESLAPSLGYRLGPGFGDRVIYRELFLQGLTILDLMETSDRGKSHSTARNEIWSLIEEIGAGRSLSRGARRSVRLSAV